MHSTAIVLKIMYIVRTFFPGMLYEF